MASTFTKNNLRNTELAELQQRGGGDPTNHGKGRNANPTPPEQHPSTSLATDNNDPKTRRIIANSYMNQNTKEGGGRSHNQALATVKQNMKNSRKISLLSLVVTSAVVALGLGLIVLFKNDQQDQVIKESMELATETGTLFCKSKERHANSYTSFGLDS